MKISEYLEKYGDAPGFIFPTKEEAEFDYKRRLITAWLRRLAESNDVMRWRDGSLKWSIVYDHVVGRLKAIGSKGHEHQGSVYFSSEEACKAAITEIGEEDIALYLFNLIEVK